METNFATRETLAFFNRFKCTFRTRFALVQNPWRGGRADLAIGPEALALFRARMRFTSGYTMAPEYDYNDKLPSGLRLAEPAVAPDRGGITAFQGSMSHQPPRQVNGVVRGREDSPMVSLDAVAAELAGASELWGGHSAEDGWVVLDREDVRNAGDSRHLVRCRDWAQVEVSRATFASNRFKGFKNYIGELPNDQAGKACRELLLFGRAFLSKIASFRVTKADLERRRREAERQAMIEARRCREAARQGIIESHRRFLEERNLPAQKVRLPSGHIHRVTHCYNCKHHLWPFGLDLGGVQEWVGDS